MALGSAGGGTSASDFGDGGSGAPAAVPVDAAVAAIALAATAARISASSLVPMVAVLSGSKSVSRRSKDSLDRSPAGSERWLDARGNEVSSLGFGL